MVLGGLKLAEADKARGTIDAAHEAAMTATMKTVIDDLSERSAPADDGATASPATTGSVVCIAGHGLFDEAVAAMLVQLLRDRGIAARAVENAATSRGAIASLHLADARVIAISYLELLGSPARLRYLVRRIRAQAPDARIVVGLWPRGEAALSDTAIQHMLGADKYVGSLGDAVETIAA